MKIFDLTHTLTNNMPVYSKPNGPDIKKVATPLKFNYSYISCKIYSYS